jgi:hypothetical protein
VTGAFDVDPCASLGQDFLTLSWERADARMNSATQSARSLGFAQRGPLHSRELSAHIPPGEFLHRLRRGRPRQSRRSTSAMDLVKKMCVAVPRALANPTFRRRCGRQAGAICAG